jgi:hypothetical protein
MQPIITRKPKKLFGILCRYAICAVIAASFPARAQQPIIEPPATGSAATGVQNIPDSLQSSSAASAEAPLYSSRTLRDKTLIAQAAGEQAQWLDTEYGRLLVLYRPTEAKQTHGVLVLFHSAEDPQTWPPILENLRANLPRFGWETLAVTLPSKRPAPAPERPPSHSPRPMPVDAATNLEAASSSSNSEAYIESPSSSSAVSREVLVQAYVEAAFNFLQDKDQQNAVVLVDNSSASTVLHQLLPQLQEHAEDPEQFDGPMQALVITNLQSQEPLNTEELSAIFANRKLPVLDVFFAPDTREQTRARDLHRAVAMRQKLDIYQQASLDSQPKIVETDPKSFLAARVRGFMQSHAKGIEEKKASATDESRTKK